jgi:hypothetical protein
MYSTCLFCHGHLGTNGVIEHFTVGRRLAFDPAKGRLWVVCSKCTRWNLTPVEERWEAIEDCERRFRETHVRVSTPQVGMARLSEGLDLVRIGEPLRPEFAAWRYGEQLRHRRRRRLAVAGGVGMAAAAVALPVAVPVIAAGAASVVGGLAVAGAFTSFFKGVSGFFTPPWALMYANMKDDLLSERVLTHVPAGRRVLTIRLKHLRDAELESRGRGELPALRVVHDTGDHAFEGTQALRAAGLLLAHANWRGASAREVDAAVRRIDRAGDAVHLLSSTAEVAQRLRGRRLMAGWRELDTLNVSYVDRLAMEMAVHEEAEHRALEGELRALETAWRQAEEIAAIADSLFVPESIQSRLGGTRELHDDA